MNEDFVTYELAVKLKEKGFREKVNAYYGKHENIFDVHPALDMNDADYRASAPTISQVLKWLREEKGWNIIVKIDKIDGWYYVLQDMEGECYVTSDNDGFSSYELTAIAGIEYVIDNLI